MMKTEEIKKECKITLIGGGTGLSVILRGLKNITSQISAIVTMADDGGSSGILREDLGLLPPGDIRNCILALADVEEQMEELLNYRFKEGMLKDQNFGNLLIAALVGIYGDFDRAVSKAHDLFAVTGKILPVTFDDVKLYAELENKQIVYGESQIPKEVIESNSKILKVHLDPNLPKPGKGVLEAIMDADFVIIGPGSLYTSIIPNLLVDGVANTIRETKAKKIFIPNVMTQPGETDGYSVFDHIDTLSEYIGIEEFDYFFINSQVLTKKELEKYEEKGATPVRLKREERKYINEKNVTIIKKDYIDIKKGYIRHNAEQIAKDILEIYTNLDI